jgi:ABC-type antimicrobial peptide transport system permease subunit
MTESSFINNLEESLRGELPESEVRQNIQYYRDYIAAARSSKSEEEVMKALGDPRLIARTIIDTYRLSHNTKNSRTKKESYQANYSGNEYRDGDSQKESRGNNSSFKVFRTPSWVITVIAVIILFLFFGIVFWIGGIMVKLFLRFILPIVLIVFGVNWIRRQFRR